MTRRGAALLVTLFCASLDASVSRRPGSFLDEPAAQAALSYERARDTAVALRLWESLVERYPSAADLWLRIARLRLRSLGREATVELAQKFRALPEAQRSAETEAGFRTLSEIFLTDQGQSLFFDAQKRARAGECTDAALLLDRALRLEGANRLILLEKARCERQLRAFTPYYETLREIDRATYLDVAFAEDLAEAHLSFKAPKVALDVVQRVPRARRTARLELVAGMAELENGDTARAADWFRATLERVRAGKLLPGAVDPLVYYGLGVAEHRGSEAVTYLRRFLDEPPRAEAPWDPYRRPERLEQAKRILAENGASSPERREAP